MPPGRLLAGAVAALALAGGCTTGPSAMPPATPRTTSTTAGAIVPAAGGPGPIADGLTLVGGDDGTLPVRVRWARRAGAEALAVDGDHLLVVGPTVSALDLRDGSVRWEEDNDGVAFDTDGGEIVGLDGPDVLRVFSPFNWELRLDRRTGRRLSFRYGVLADPDPPLQPLATTPPAAYQIDPGLEEVVGRWPGGPVAWRLRVTTPEVSAGPGIAAGDAVVVYTSNGYVVVLDPAP